MIFMKSLFSLLLFLTVALFGAQKEVTLQLSWTHQFQFAGYYVAKEKGYYRDAGIQLKLLENNGSVDVVDTVLSGKADFGVWHSSVILSAHRDILLLAALFQSSPSVLLSLQRDDIRTLSDIRGKKIMLYDSVENVAAIGAMLRSEGIGTYDFKAVAPRADNVEALLTKEADLISAYRSNEPYTLSSKGYHYRIFDPKKYGFDFYDDILFTRKSVLQSDPKLVDDFYTATLQGWRYAFEHIDETIALIRRKYNPHKSADALRYEALTLKKLAYHKRTPLGKIDPPRLREITAIYRLMGADIPKETDFTQLIYRPKNPRRIILDRKERAWLQKHGTVRLCARKGRRPLEYFQNGIYKGMGEQMRQLLERVSGAKITPLLWRPDRRQQCDLYMWQPSERNASEEMTVSAPIIRLPLFVSTRLQQPFITRLSDLGNVTVGTVKGYGFARLLHRKYPYIKVVTYESALAGLRAVANGKIYAYIDFLPVLNRAIVHYFAGSLKVNAPVGIETGLGIGVNVKEKILAGIIQKSLDVVDKKTRDVLQKSWHDEALLHEKNRNEALRTWLTLIGIVVVLLFYKYLRSLHANRLLQESIEEFEMLMEAMMEGIILFSSEGVCLRANSKAAELFGYTKEEMAGIRASDFVSEASLKQVREAMRIDNVAPYEAKLKRRDGTMFDAMVRGKNVIWKGKPIRISTIIDISGLKRLQYDLEKLNAELEEKVREQVDSIREKEQMLLHQNKLAAMGEMIGAIAHQWRQPLNVLNIHIQNLDDDFEEGLIDRAFIDRFIETNSEIIRFMSRTIDEFRNFYRIDKVRECFFVKEAIEKTVSMQEARLRSQNILCEVRGDDFCISGYRHEFQQVILNLLNNAADAVARAEVRYGKIEIMLEEMTVRINDNAGGIDPSIIDRIFEPYFTTKKEGEGTGIGLYMSKMIIERHMGGTLQVQNIENGASFIIGLADLCSLSREFSGRMRDTACIADETKKEALHEVPA